MRPLPFVHESARPAVIAPLSVAHPSDLPVLARAAQSAGADALEWRLDALEVFSGRLEAHDAPRGRGRSAVAEAVDLAGQGLGELSGETSLPIVLTVRTSNEGGAAHVTDEEYASLITAFAELRPAAIDIEHGRQAGGELYDRVRTAGICALASAHDFAGTPSAQSLVELCTAMAAAGADVAKFAVMPNKAADVWRALDALGEASSVLSVPVIGISMGELGRASRVMGGDCGAAATFASVDSASAPGQLSVADMRTLFDVLYPAP